MSENASQRVGIDIETTYSGKGAEAAKRDVEQLNQSVKKSAGEQVAASQAQVKAANDQNYALKGLTERLGFAAVAQHVYADAALRTATAMGSLGVVLGGAIAVTIAATVANERWNRSLNQTNAMLLASGRSAEISRGQLAALVADMERAANMDRAGAFAAVGALAQSPGLRGGMLADLGRLVPDYAAATGKSPAEAARDLGKAFGEPTQGARQLSAALGILSADQLLMIERMDAQGRRLEAQKLLYSELEKRIKGVTEQGITPLQSATNRLGNAWNDIWERMYQSPAFAKVAAGVGSIVGGMAWVLEKADPGAGYDDPMARGLGRNRPRPKPDAARPNAIDPAAALEEQVNRALESGSQYDPNGTRRRSLGDAAIQTRSAMEALAGAGRTDSESYRRLQAQLAGINREAARRTPEENAAEQMDRVIGRLKSEASRAADELEESPEIKRYFEAIERITTGDLHERSLGQRQQYAAAATERFQAEQKARQDKQIVATGYAGSPEFMKLLKEQNEDYGWAGRETAQESEKVKRLREEMVHATQQSNARILQDDSSRAWRSFEEEKRVWARRIEELKPLAEERKQIEEDYAQWVVSRHAEITEQLKPQWQKIVDAYGDITRSMRDFQDRFVIGGLRAGENAFVRWAETGKISARDLFGTLRDEIARTVYQKQFAAPIAGGLGSLANIIFGGGGATIPADVAAGYGTAYGHAGGVVGEIPITHRMPASLFAGAKRYHSGGLVPGEVPIIAKRGEEVLTESDPRHRRNGGGNVRVEIVNQGTPQEATSAQPFFDTEGMVVRIVMRDMTQGGPIRGAVESLVRPAA